MLPTNVMSFMKKMVTVEPGSGNTATDTTDSGTTFGKLKQTLSSSLLTAQDKVTKMSPRPSIVPDTTEQPSIEDQITLKRPENKKPTGPTINCRICIKAFKPDDLKLTCAECARLICEDCACFTKEEEEDLSNWVCHGCRKKKQSRAVLNQDSSESLLEIPLQELQRRHSEARLGSSGIGGGGGVGGGLAPTTMSGLALPRSPELRRHSDVSPASLKELEKLKSGGGKTPEPDWSRGRGRNLSTANSRQNSPPREPPPSLSIGVTSMTPAATSGAPRSRRGSRVSRQRSCDDEKKSVLAAPILAPGTGDGGGGGGSALGPPAAMPRRASAYDVFSVPGAGAAALGRRASFRVPPPEPASPPSPEKTVTSTLMTPEEERRTRRRGSQLPDIANFRPPRPTPALEDLEATPRRQASIDAEAIRIVIHDVDSGTTAAASQRRVVLRKDPTDKAYRTRGFGMRVVGGKTGADGRLFAYVVWTVPGGVAEKCGLQQGDKVLEWGGTSLIDRSFEEVCAIMDRTGDVVELMVEHATDLRMCDLLDDPLPPPTITQQTVGIVRKPSDAAIAALHVEPESDKSPSSPTRRKLPKTPEQLARERIVSGRIQIQVWYNDEKRELVVAVLAADDLMARDDTLGYGALPEAYARLCLLPLTTEEHCMQTEVAPASQNPIWNANLSFGGVPGEELMERTLEITLWDLIPHNEHAFLGECTVDLQKAFLDDRAVWCRLEDPRQLRGGGGRSPHTSPRASIVGGKRADFSTQRSTSDDVDSIGECASLLHPDHAWGSRRGSSQSEQLEVEVYQLGKDFSRSLPGSRRSSFQSAQEQQQQQQQQTEEVVVAAAAATVAPSSGYDRARRRSSCTRMLRDPEEILRSLKAVKGELGRTMSLSGNDKRHRRSSTSTNRKDSTVGDISESTKESTGITASNTTTASPPSSPERLSPPRLGPGQVKPRGGYRLPLSTSTTRPVELKLGLLMTKGQLEVEVVCARHIPSREPPLPDTYVKCYLRDGDRWLQKRKTRVVRHTCEPQFRQTLRYQACDVLGRNLLVMLWERQGGFEHNQGIGGAEVALDALTLTQLTTGWYPLFPINSLGSDSNESP